MSGDKKKHLVVIAGPTAVGKTDLSIRLAKHYHSVILSADSRQFYSELSIGTAKPDEQQLKEVPHYFISNKSVTELYGAGHFSRDARALLDDLFNEHDLVFLVGGSGLYIDALLNGVDDFAEIPETLRETINAELKEKGIDWLQAEVKKADPEQFASMDQQNPQRLVRVLEVCRYTGLPYSSFLNKQNTRNNRTFKVIKLLVTTERKQLYDRINKRVDDMMQRGLLEEARAFSDQRHLNALKTVGYRELYDYFDGQTDLQTAVDKIKQHTRNYAKRQLTWFRNRDQFREFEVGTQEEIIAYIDQQRMLEV